MYLEDRMKGFIKAVAMGVVFVGIIALNLAVLAGGVAVIVWVLRAMGVLATV